MKLFSSPQTLVPFDCRLLLSTKLYVFYCSYIAIRSKVLMIGVSRQNCQQSQLVIIKTLLFLVLPKNQPRGHLSFIEDIMLGPKLCITFLTGSCINIQSVRYHINSRSHSISNLSCFITYAICYLIFCR